MSSLIYVARTAFLPSRFRLGSAKKINECHPNAITLSPCGRPPRSHRRMVEGMIYRARVGCPWRDLPDVFGPWKSVYTRWRRWNQMGVWASVLQWMEPCVEGHLRHLDATHVKLHQDAANPAQGQCLQAMGRTRGGLNTKVTALVDGRGRAIQVRIDSGPRPDVEVAEEMVPPAGKCLVADKGYDSDHLREHFRKQQVSTSIAPRITRKNRVPFNRAYYRLRHRVENFFQRMKRFRALSTRYDKLASNFLAAVQMVAVLDWICFKV